jgi:LacI family transcriptional regulator
MTIPFVSCNDYESGLHATKHLLEKGCRNIVFIGIDESISVTADRLEGYKAALSKMNITVKDLNILLCKNQEEAYEQILKRLKEQDKADAFFSSVERYTVQLYRVCEELTLKIPADLKVISFSNNPLASFMNPPLSAITQPAFEIGKSAAGLLLDMLKKKKPATPKDLVIPCTFHYTVSSLGN